MTVLITGSRGKTARPLATLLQQNPSSPIKSLTTQPPILIASRNPSLDPNVRLSTVRLNWHDPSTFGLPFAHPLVRRSPIVAVYLVGDPTLYQPSSSVLAFVKYARERGVKRFVLLSAWEVGEGEAFLMGPMHAALKGMGGEGVEWAVLRPQFFMGLGRGNDADGMPVENFAETYTLNSIRDQGAIYSAADEGKVAFVSAEDIAAVAHRALTDEVPHNTDHVITGGEALTYDEVAQIFSEVLGRKIEHKKLNQKAFEAKLRESGHLSKEMIKYMVGLDDDIACGRGSHMTDTVESLLGRKPKTMREFVEENKVLWSNEVPRPSTDD